MLEVFHIYIKDVVVRAENDVDVPEPAYLTLTYHLEPFVVQSLLFELELCVLVKIPYHSTDIWANLRRKLEIDLIIFTFETRIEL